MNRYPCLSAFIRAQKGSEFVGATRRVVRTEFEVKGDKALFLTLGTLGTRNFRHFLIRVYLCLSVSRYKIFGLRLCRAVPLW